MNNDQVLPVLVALIVLAVYAGLIILGVRLAKSKKRSPHWMWFAVHPMGLLIVLIVMACLQPLKECPQCAQTMKAQARLCAFCGYRFTGSDPQSLPAAEYTVGP